MPVAAVQVDPPRADPLRIVVVTMDSHMASAMARAEASLQADMPGVRISVHAADEWGHDAKALAACNDDIATGDIVVATMLFLDDHIRSVLPALTARRNQCDAMLCCISASEVVKLTRLGKVDMSTEATGVMAMLKKLRGPRKAAGSAGHAQNAHAARGCRACCVLFRAPPRTCGCIFWPCNTGWPARSAIWRTWCACWPSATRCRRANRKRDWQRRRRRRSIIQMSACITPMRRGASSMSWHNCRTRPARRARSGCW